MVGAAGGLCCYLFIGRGVVPAIEEYKKTQQATKDAPGPDATAIVSVFGQLWELFLAPGVGALEHTWKS